ncbi:RNA-binding CRS1 / YhbY (CRM) domain protein [Actinidia rufa]|uniref:RNA-binding CRS1 / YhbY (CRM) domain protein n=1 Tax=Actinidia rufa TaxID=165716 RepID=A0A7J0ELA1_9ERIC|nr:RNA-binding CRS1 / YhbY (CRM) domain protein [Actinidia rufa]
MDGSSVHFFHRTINAYATGKRKRRKIHNQDGMKQEGVRWHKTGKTKSVMENGVQKGYKKIMVLYRTSKKGSKPDKANWAMHQYHLGTAEDEIGGQFVVSKIFYQLQKQSDNTDSSRVMEDSDLGTIQTTPRTPKTNTPNPPRPQKFFSCDDITDDYLILPRSPAQEAEFITETSHPSTSGPSYKEETETHTWLAGESQAVDGNGVDDPLLCNENLNSYVSLDDLGLNDDPSNDFSRLTRDAPEVDRNPPCGIADLENLELDTPPDFQLADLYFDSQDSIFGCPEAITMFAARNLQNRCFKTLPSLILTNPFKNVLSSSDIPSKFTTSDVIQSSFQTKKMNLLDGSRAMSTGLGRSMRSKVERRMRKESGKTLREIRRAKDLRKKLMTDEERLIYNLRRAKKKVALLLQKLKKYELPELPTPRHDPELLTPEQLQAYKKIGFRNKNYVPVGVRGVFGGVVQNMHLHWKFHETVQICCDNFPKEKIKEMATMLARLSGGIVINIHNVKTIIMFRGRKLSATEEFDTYQHTYKKKVSAFCDPENRINSYRNSKALFKARFEQALESQKLNIKKIEQQLRRKGVNPDDPVALASIQRVASTFFNAIDKKAGSPYVFREDKQFEAIPSTNLQQSEPADDSDQEELDRFIAEIEDAADKEWAAEEAAEKEEFGKIRYLNREDFGGRFRRSEMLNSEDSDTDIIGGERDSRDVRSGRRRTDNSDNEDDDEDDLGVMSDYESDTDEHDRAPVKFGKPKLERGKQNGVVRVHGNETFGRNAEVKFSEKMLKEDSESEGMLSGMEDAMWQSDSEEEQDLGQASAITNNYKSSTGEEEDYLHMKRYKNGVDVANHFASNTNDFDEGPDQLNMSRVAREKENKSHKDNNCEAFDRNAGAKFRGKTTNEKYESEDLFSDSETATWGSDVQEDLDSETSRLGPCDYRSNSEDGDCVMKKDGKDGANDKKMKASKQVDEAWDSD